MPSLVGWLRCIQGVWARIPVHVRLGLLLWALIIVPGVFPARAQDKPAIQFYAEYTKNQLEVDAVSIPPGAASLAFVFDITGSMYDDLVQVIGGAAKILATTLARREQPLYNYVLVPFHDPEIGPVTVTTDHYKFQKALKDLYVQGGGDCPEMSVGAIRAALVESLPNSFVYVFTDARAKDYDLTEEVLTLIQSKQSQVTFVLTGDCGNHTHPGYQSFEQIASISSGQVFSLKKNQVGEILEPLREALQTRKVNLLSLDRDFAGEMEIKLPIDSRLEEFTVQVSGDKPKVTVYDPNGVKLNKKEGLNVLLNLKQAYTVNMKEPDAGHWSLKISSNGPHSIRITGRSTLDFVHGFSRQATFDMSGTTMRPIKGVPSFVLLNATDLTFPGRFHKMELLDLHADTIMELPLVFDITHPSFYNLTSFVPPNDFFYIKVNGEDEDGNDFIRTTHTAIKSIPPVVPLIQMDPTSHGYYDKTAVLTCGIQSLVPFTVQWYRGEQLLGNKLYFSESADATWSVRDASSFSEGEYTCNATNAAGSSAKTTFLDVKDPPPQILKPANASVLPEQEAMLTCIAYSSVAYNVTWYKTRPGDLHMEERFTVYSNGSFIISSAVLEDEGPYVCRAQNEGGYNEERVWLQVQRSPKVTAVPSQANFVRGGSANLSCVAEGFPPPTFVWMQGDKVLPISSKTVYDSEGRIEFRGLQESDSGEYECVASNAAGIGKAVITLYYTERPVLHHKQQRVLVANGDTATLICDSDAVPEPKVTWFKDNVQIDQSYSYIEINAEGHLIIIGTQEMDGGQYKCVVTNSAGYDDGIVNVQVGAVPKIVNGPSSQGVKIQSNLSLPCLASGTPKPKVTWHGADGQPITLRGKFSQSLSGALNIQGISKDDEGMYRCHVENQFGRDEVSAYITITGIVAPLLAYGLPKVQTLEGRTVRLRCQVLLGSPWPKLTWYNDGEIVHNSDRVTVDGNGNLMLSNITVEQEGLYTCLASNVGGNQTLETIVDVQVPPVIHDTGRDKFVAVLGNYIRLPCDAEGDPKPTVTWTKNGKRIEESQAHYFLREDGSLEVFSLTPDDTASYSCTAVNTVGSAEKRLSLFVQTPPKLSSSQEKYEVIVNNPVQMTCDAEGVPPPTITWEKDGEILTRLNQNLMFLPNGALRLEAAQVKDEGLYQCTASSPAGNTTKLATLVVQVPPRIQDAEDLEVVSLVGEEVLLPCHASGDPYPDIKWSKNQVPIDFYDLSHGYMIQEGGSLYISQVATVDAGKYECHVENPAGFLTKDISLTVREIPQILYGIPNATSVIEYKYVNLPCPVRGTPTPTITWYKDDQEIIPGQVEGVKINSDGSLDIERALASHAGRYVCEAENMAGSDRHTIDVDVFFPPRFTDESGNIMIGEPLQRPEKLQIIQNETFYLRCPAAANPPPQITWFKDGQELRVQSLPEHVTLSDDGKFLKVTSAQVSDTGTYTCIANNLAGEMEKDTDVDVFVPPSFDQSRVSPYNLSSAMDNTAFINCHVHGVPRPSIVWYKDGKLISDKYQPNLRFLENNQQLEIASTYTADDGMYKCVAENPAGTLERSFQFHVLVPARIEGSGEVSHPETVVNSSLTLHCPAFGIPPPSIDWYIDGISIKDYKPSPVMRMRKYKRLMIPGSSTTTVPTTTKCVRKMPTKNGNSNGAPCFFPFLRDGKKYYSCYGQGDNAWCGTTYNFDRDQKWGFCDFKKEVTCGTNPNTAKPHSSTVTEATCVSHWPTRGGTARGANCVFPYVYQNQQYNKCQVVHPDAWCATTSNFDKDKEWGYCDFDAERICYVRIVEPTTLLTTSTTSISPRMATGSPTTCISMMPTKGGNSNGAPCIFPYVYGDRIYNACQGPKEQAWCSTTYDYGLDEMWGYCDFENQLNCEVIVTKPSKVTEVKCTTVLPTRDGNSGGKPCVFPFIYFDKEYSECLGQGISAWCATTQDFDKDEKWGFCDFENEKQICDTLDETKFSKTPEPTTPTTESIKITADTSSLSSAPCLPQIWTDDGVKCVFPFLYGGIEQNGCVVEIGSAPWCGTTYNYDYDNEWGYCDLDSEIECPGTPKTTRNQPSTVIIRTSRPVNETPKNTRTRKTTTERTPSTSETSCLPQIWTNDGIKCVFPFLYGGIEQSECVPEVGYAWCATTYNYDTDDIWGYCDLDSEIECPGTPKTTKRTPSTITIGTIRPVNKTPKSTIIRKTTTERTPSTSKTSCLPQIWTDDGVKCVFPFLYGGIEQNGCVVEIGTAPWCGTTYNYDYDNEWGYCDLDSEIECPGTPTPTRKPPSTVTIRATDIDCPQISTDDGVKCVFPFLYGGIEQNGCVVEIGTAPWCGTTYNYDYDNEWGYCDLDSEIECPGTSKITGKPPSTVIIGPSKSVDKTPKSTILRKITTERTPSTSETSCLPQIWTDDGVKCVFPFLYGGIEQNGCVVEIGSAPWCGTTYNYDYDNEWGYCDLDSEIECLGTPKTTRNQPSTVIIRTSRPVNETPKNTRTRKTTTERTPSTSKTSCLPQIWTDDGVKCVFPFLYGGIEQNGCVVEIGSASWCGTTYNYDYDNEWGYCDLDSEIECPGTSKTTRKPPSTATTGTIRSVNKTPKSTIIRKTTTERTPSTSKTSCLPQIWTDDGVKCVFPFLYGGIEQNGCVVEIGSAPWCGTTYNYDYDNEWGYCDLDSEIECPGTPTPTRKPPSTVTMRATDIDCPQIWTDDGVKCVFPFLYGGIEQNGCVVEIGSTPWCGTTYNFDYDNEWGYCDLDSEIECPGTSKTTRKPPSTATTGTIRSVNKTPKSTIITKTMTERTASTSKTSCLPQIWTDDGVKCVFPFLYGGIEQNGCVVEIGSAPWCGTTYNFDYDNEWGYCDLDSEIECPGTPTPTRKPPSTVTMRATDIDCPQIWTDDGVKCVFPFLYGGIEQNGCVVEIGTAPWCGITYNFDYDNEWGYCDLDSEIECLDTSKTTRKPPSTFTTGTIRPVNKTPKPTIFGKTTTETTPSTSETPCLPQIWTDDDVKCVFPFLFRGIEQNGCVVVKGTAPWCGTTYNYDYDNEWGYCDLDSEIECKEATVEERIKFTKKTIRDTTKSPSQACCIPTKGGNAEGAVCVFPFLYNGEKNYKCKGKEQNQWCATTYDYDTDQIWGKCDFENSTPCGNDKKNTFMETSIASSTTIEVTKYEIPTEWNPDDPGECGKIQTTDGQVCTFPFLHDGIEYNACYNGWCATTYDYDVDGLWGYCDTETELKCLKTSTYKTTTKTLPESTTYSDYNYYYEQGGPVTSKPDCELEMFTTTGEECVFPFLYYASEQHECYDGWCSTTYNYDVDGLWGYCDLTTKKCKNERKRRDIDWALYNYVDPEEDDQFTYKEYEYEYVYEYVEEEVEGSGEQQLEWAKRVQVLDNGFKLNIHRAKATDALRYSCQAENEAGKAEKFFDLTVLAPPRIQRDSIEWEPSVVVNQSVVLECPVSGIPQPSVHWYRNGTLLQLLEHPNIQSLEANTKLRIDNVQVVDSGYYKCEAKNKAGSDQVMFTLSVQVPTMIDKTGLKTNPNIVVNKTLTLHCPVFGIPAPRIEWYKNSELIESDITNNVRLQAGGQKLVLQSIQPGDAGTYECKAVNSVGMDSLEYNVQVYVAPYIDGGASTSRNPEVIVNNSITLNCVVYGIPNPTVKWLVDKQPLGDNPRFQLQANKRQLEIRGSQVSDTATYTCVAKNQAGNARRDFSLVVLVPPYIDGDKYEKLNVIAGKVTTLNCPAMGIPFPNVTWYRNNHVLQENSRVKFLLKGRQLRISNVHARDSDSYKCRASNTAGRAQKHFKLNVLIPPKIDQANVVDNPRVIMDRTVLLECPVSGIPPPQVTWFKNGKPLKLLDHQSLLQRGKNLEIRKVQVTDTARYTCVATNEAGKSQQNFDLEILVPPTIPMAGNVTHIEAVQNKTVYISCDADGLPFPSIMWFRETTPLLDFPYQNLRELNGGRQLEIRNVNADDEGMYTCEANNPAGLEKKAFRLKVLIPPEISTRSKPELVATVGRSVRIDCDGTGEPSPNITWYQDGKPLTYSNTLRNIRDGRLLHITSIEIDHAGVYTCRAENIAGMDEMDFQIEVQIPPQIENAHLMTDVSVVIGKSITLKCPGTGLPEPEINWYRKGQKLAVYSDPNLKLQANHRNLVVLNTQRNDEGAYSCEAKNPAGKASKEFLLKVIVPPSIEEGPTLVASKVGSSTVLECEAYGVPIPKVIWEKDGFLMPRNGQHYRQRSSGSLEFSGVKVEDTATYKCLVENEGGQAETSIQLNVMVPPKISHDRPVGKKVTAGLPVELPCSATGIPKPTVVWQKGTRQLKNQGGYQLLPSGSLLIEEAQVSDAGTYVCYVSNDAGSDIGQVRLRVLVSPKIASEKRSYQVIQEDELTLPCRPEGIPKPRITWTKDGMPISPADFRYRLMSNGWLAIPIASVQESGVYDCTAKNEAGQDVIQMEVTVLVPPAIAETDRSVTLIEGQTATLKCDTSGFPKPKITWIQKGQTPVDTGDRYAVNTDGTLTITNVKGDESGQYACTAVNKAGRDSKQVMLKVQVPPKFVKTLRDQEVALHRRIELECGAEGTPTPVISWRVNNTAYPSPPSVRGFSRLVIDHAMKRDDGTYMCLAENPAGTRKSLAAIRIKEPPLVLIRNGFQAFTLSGKTMLHCPVKGDPPFEIVWTKNGRDIKVDGSRIMQYSNGSLAIYDASDSDAGAYECLASNDAGTSTGVVSLTLTYAPRFQVEPQDISVDLGGMVFLNCLVEGEPQPTVSWRKGQTVLEEADRLYMLPNNSLRIIAAQVEDSGNYICIATNKLGKILKQAEVIVQVHGHWSPWSLWSACSETCGEGVHHRTRECDNPAPQNDGRPCTGIDRKEKPCKLTNCALNGEWESWSAWSTCSATCGSHGAKQRTRRCQQPRFGGTPCEGDETQRESCQLLACPENGGWSVWAGWTMCSVSCGGGQRTRYRACDNPRPSRDGADCAGQPRQIDYCNEEPCPVHGNWTEWSDWGDCTLSCDGGQQRRFRYCTNPAPKHNGQPCMGPGTDTQPCNSQPCEEDPLWGPWSDWGPCSRSCDGGTQSRQRYCSITRHRRHQCVGDPSQIRKCNPYPCSPLLPRYAEGNIIGNLNDNKFGVAKLRANISRTGSGALLQATLNNVPANVAKDLQPLVSLLSPIYWVVATEVGRAVNGYTLTHGQFHRESQVTFSSGEVTRLTHVSRGVNREGVLEVDIVLQGYVPHIPAWAPVKPHPYVEDYIQTGAGTLYSHSSRVISVDGHMLPHFWNHSISYDSDMGSMPFLVQRLTTDALYVEVDRQTEILNYALTASISRGHPSNQCPQGFILDQAGPYCIDWDECMGRVCSHDCVNTRGSFKCSCPRGLALDQAGRTCADIDECGPEYGKCSHSCSNTVGSYSCHCPTGMTTTRDRHTCQDIDECDQGIHSCQSDEQCVNNVGSFRCVSTCQPGYHRRHHSQQCTDIDECRRRDVCEQECVNMAGSYRCTCRPGYRVVDNYRCQDINECREGSSHCKDGCVNTRGSFRCQCSAGYTLTADGGCQDVNECERRRHRCRSDQECQNSEGGYSCINRCPPGYTRTHNASCVDLDECSTGQHQCYSNQRCMNTPGAYTCLCPRGYRSDGPGRPCIDTDDCSSEEGRRRCSYKCANVAGSFRCVCPPGQKLLADRKSCAGLTYLEPVEIKGKSDCPHQNTGHCPPPDKDTPASCPLGYVKVRDTCVDIDECSSSRRCQHKCRNTEGSYECSCPRGYRLSSNRRTCQDVDECTEERVNCGQNRVCFNRRGDYQCIDVRCPANYIRDPQTGHCLLPCDRSNEVCPEGARYADILEFKLLALPNGIPSYQDLIRLIAYDQYRNHLSDTSFVILENDQNAAFGIRLEDGKGVVYTLHPLEESRQYQIKVRAKSYHSRRRDIQYQTTFMIHISVSLYPY